MPIERVLFRRFEMLQPLGPALYQIQFRLGEGMPPDPDWPDWLAQMAKALTQRRVDVLASTPTTDWILEIKPRAGPSALGQLLVYRALYIQQFPDRSTPNLGIIADRNSYDMAAAYSEFNIRLFLV
jgi:hypothetical protein